MNKIQADSRDSKRKTNAVVLSEALEKYYEENGEYPSVPAVTDTNIANVKSILNISDTDVLTMPKASSGTNSLTQSTASEVKIAYTGSTIYGPLTDCTTKVDGSCDTFSLRWKDEDGEQQKIDSRHLDRILAGEQELAAPDNPRLNSSIIYRGSSYMNLNTWVTFINTSNALACPVGTVEYKIKVSSVELERSASAQYWST